MAGPVTGSTGAAGTGTGQGTGVSSGTGPGVNPATGQPWTQSQILEALGVPAAQLPELKLQLDGNGRLQQYYNQLAALDGYPQPFDPSLASTIIQDLLPLAAIIALPVVVDDAGAGAATTSAEGESGAAAAAAESQGGLTLSWPGSTFSGVPWDSTAQGSSLGSGYHAFRYAFQAALPSLQGQLDILAHRGIGG